MLLSIRSLARFGNDSKCRVSNLKIKYHYTKQAALGTVGHLDYQLDAQSIILNSDSRPTPFVL